MGRMQFEIGKQYVCANGKVVVVKVPHGEGFVGSEILGHSSLEQQSFVYEPDGRPRGNDYAEWTIIKEFRFDGPREIIDPEYEVSRLGPHHPVYRQESTFGGPSPKKPHENVTDRLDGLDRHIKGHVVSINALNQRISKMDEEAALNLTATDTRLDRLSSIINTESQLTEGRFNEIDARVKALFERTARLDKLENLPGLATLNRAVVDINDRLDRFAIEVSTKANAEGVKGELADRATMGDIRQVHSRLNRISSRLGILLTDEEIIAAGPTPIERKRLYAGGWLNIYVNDVTGKLSVGVLQDDKAACDKLEITGPKVRRIACMPLTRIREGDGL